MSELAKYDLKVESKNLSSHELGFLSLDQYERIQVILAEPRRDGEVYIEEEILVCTMCDSDDLEQEGLDCYVCNQCGHYPIEKQ